MSLAPAPKRGRGKDKCKRKMSQASLANLQYRNDNDNICSYLCTYDVKLILPSRKTNFVDDEWPTEPGEIEDDAFGGPGLDCMKDCLVGMELTQDDEDDQHKKEEIKAFHRLLQQSGQMSEASTFAYAIAKQLGCSPAPALHWELSPKRRSIHCHYIMTKSAIGVRECFRMNGIACATRMSRLAKSLNKRKGLFATCNVKVYKRENYVYCEKYLTKGEKSGLYYNQPIV